ncbi:multiple sugar transport system permease protein [Pseudonocardia thermophila]|uniref:Multiple sugar transport system permease protein n=2 Tax=Pseudonocardia thermophila TaxID=1848 RepID=A0A1M6WQ71_PSETH|nr:multiple sugar transport system permease protein [Pseudonocardia thermophila]
MALTLIRSASRAKVSPMSRADRQFGLRLSAPALALLAMLLVVPAVLTLVYSFHDVPPTGIAPGEFIGLTNYETVFGSPVFWSSLWVTIVFSLGFVVVSTCLGLGFALLLNEAFPGRGILRGLLVIPWACPWLVIGIIWRWFVDGSVGGLNGLLMHLGLTDGYIDFLSNPRSALIIAVIGASWRQACFAAILLLAGLQTLPKELNEAAAIDGAGPLGRFRHVTIPWLRPVLATVIVLNIIYAFLQFDVIFAMTQGGPGDATQVLSILIYRQLFVATDIGTGSALAVILALLSLVGGLITVRLLYRNEA